ncbi:unnamed protein product [Polarella glacialis]|uniref:Uncharacterized protein n=1 Tax=Polarella glacialis TaxID=89957 RepID=A0A813EJF8_POLGL|nr:unnamed protein product [Polarella glacialis]
MWMYMQSCLARSFEAQDCKYWFVVVLTSQRMSSSFETPLSISRIKAALTAHASFDRTHGLVFRLDAFKFAATMVSAQCASRVGPFLKSEIAKSLTLPDGRVSAYALTCLAGDEPVSNDAWRRLEHAVVTDIQALTSNQQVLVAPAIAVDAIVAADVFMSLPTTVIDLEADDTGTIGSELVLVSPSSLSRSVSVQSLAHSSSSVSRSETSELVLLLRDAFPEYNVMDKHQLIALLSVADSALVRKAKELRAVKQELRRVKTKLEDMVSASRHACETEEALAIERCGVKRLSQKGVIAIAVRRNFSSISAYDLGAVLMENISGQTVIRAELLLAASLTASSRYFHLDARSDMRSPWPEGTESSMKFRVACYSFRSDATNSCIWQNAKLHGTETRRII